MTLTYKTGKKVGGRLIDFGGGKVLFFCGEMDKPKGQYSTCEHNLGVPFENIDSIVFGGPANYYLSECTVKYVNKEVQKGYTCRQCSLHFFVQTLPAQVTAYVEEIDNITFEHRN